MPPPSTKSNSPRPVRQRFASEPLTSRRRGVTATLPPSAIAVLPPMRRAAPALLAGSAFATASSTSVFHSPQTSQRPCHFA
jgi:hypothetical protein